MNILIVAAAPETDYAYVKQQAAQADYVICADAGLRHAAACGLTPDLLVGDFDSGMQPPAGIRTIRLKPEKDDIDLMCCTRQALTMQPDTITYVCASGGRIDHFLANLSLLEYVHSCGARAVFCDSRNRVTFHPGRCLMRYQADPSYKYLGIVPLDATLEHVTLRGLKYELTDATLYRAEIISTSNEPAAQQYSIEIGTGCALVIESKDK